MIRYPLTPKLQEIFDYLSEKAKKAYLDSDLLSEPVLSKNPFSSSFVKDYLEGNFNKKMGIEQILKAFFYYFRHIVCNYIKFVITFYMFRFFFKPTKTLAKEITLIDTYFGVDNVLKEKSYKDRYFLDLDSFLLKHNKFFAYLFVFYQPALAKMCKVFSILKKQKVNFVCEFSLLKISDLFRIFFFIVRYPFKVLRYVSRLDAKNEKDALLKYSMLKSIATSSFLPYTRYLQGKRLARLVDNKATLVSWYENQTIDKCLYKGINDTTDKIYIKGVQAFLLDPSFLSILVDENEIPLGIVPDKIFVNGQYYLPQNDTDIFAVGPSFRYKKLFDFDFILRKNPCATMILLAYSEENSRLLLKLLDNIKLQEPIFIKAHPSTPYHLFSDLLKANYRVVSDDIYGLAKSAKIIVASATGAIAEMAALSIPVIVVKGNNVCDDNPMMDLGKGVLWHYVATQEELLRALEATDEVDQQELLTIGKQYKEMFFCEPNEENIKKMFEIA